MTVPSRATFKLVKPIVARAKDGPTTITIPSGSIVEVIHPAVADAVEVEWEGEVHSVSLRNLRCACKED